MRVAFSYERRSQEHRGGPDRCRRRPNAVSARRHLHSDRGGKCSPSPSSSFRALPCRRHRRCITVVVVVSTSTSSSSFSSHANPFPRVRRPTKVVLSRRTLITNLSIRCRRRSRSFFKTAVERFYFFLFSVVVFLIFTRVFRLFKSIQTRDLIEKY